MREKRRKRQRRTQNETKYIEMSYIACTLHCMLISLCRITGRETRGNRLK